MKKYKILIVDDQSFIRKILKLRLTKAGFEVIEAKNGMEALDHTKRLNPDLILLDIMMPGMNGFEVLSKIKSNLKLSDIKIVMLTAKGLKSDVDKAIKLGADYYFRKPFDFNIIWKKIREILNITEDLNSMYNQNIEKAFINRMKDAVKNNETDFIEKLPLFLLDSKYNSAVRCEAAITIAMFKAKNLYQHLIKALEDNDPMVREKVIWAIGELGIERAFGKLCSLMKDQDETIDVKMACVLAIKQLGKDEEVQDLLDSFTNMVKEQRMARRKKRRKKKKKKVEK